MTAKGSWEHNFPFIDLKEFTLLLHICVITLVFTLEILVK
jgi:hypothetical protein